jgi:hypothetical protein
MTPARIVATLAGLGLVALVVGSAAASSSSDPQAPAVPGQPSTVVRTAPAELWLRSISSPRTEEPLPGTLSTGLTSRHIGP